MATTITKGSEFRTILNKATSPQSNGGGKIFGRVEPQALLTAAAKVISSILGTPSRPYTAAVHTLNDRNPELKLNIERSTTRQALKDSQSAIQSMIGELETLTKSSATSTPEASTVLCSLRKALETVNSTIEARGNEIDEELRGYSQGWQPNKAFEE